MVDRALGRTVGLISVSSPQSILVPDKSNILDTYCFVVVATTTDARIKLFYSLNDSGKMLKALLMENNVSESIAFAMITAANKQMMSDTYGDSPQHMAKHLPGVLNLTAKHPVHGIESTLYGIVINLNDQYRWTRENIADWIENTFDTKDIAFQVPGEVEDEKGILSKFTKVVTIKRVL